MIMAKICKSPLYAYEMDSHTIAELLIHTKMKLLKLFPFTCTKFNHVHKTLIMIDKTLRLGNTYSLISVNCQLLTQSNYCHKYNNIQVMGMVHLMITSLINSDSVLCFRLDFEGNTWYLYSWPDDPQSVFSSHYLGRCDGAVRKQGVGGSVQGEACPLKIGLIIKFTIISSQFKPLVAFFIIKRNSPKRAC